MDRAKETSQAFNINFLTFLMDETENPYKVATSSAYQIHIGQVHSKKYARSNCFFDYLVFLITITVISKAKLVVCSCYGNLSFLCM